MLHMFYDMVVQQFEGPSLTPPGSAASNWLVALRHRHRSQRFGVTLLRWSGQLSISTEILCRNWWKKKASSECLQTCIYLHVYLEPIGPPVSIGGWWWLVIVYLRTL